MLSRLGLALLCVCMAHGALRQVTVSQANFASIAVSLTTTEYNNLLAEAKALEPATTNCTTTFQAQNESCLACANGITQCGSVSALDIFLYTMKNPSMLGTLAQTGLEALGNTIAGGAKTLYNKYGAGPVNNLKAGFNLIGEKFAYLGDQFKQGFEIAFNGLKNTFSGMFSQSFYINFGKGFVDLFSGRRKRAEPSHLEYENEADSYVEHLENDFEAERVKRDDNEDDDGNEAVALEEPVDRKKRATELTEAQKNCIKSKCPVCIPFINALSANADPYDTWRTICGADIINKNLALEQKINQVQAFYKVLTGSTVDVLKEIWVDTSTGYVSKIVAWTGTAYATYTPSGIQFDPWDQDPAYKSIAQYLLKTH